MKPEVTYDVKLASWELTEDFLYRGYGVELLIPKGFQTDLSSIPRFFWREIAPFELSITAPVVHDYLYRHGGRYVSLSGQMCTMTRAEVDALFLHIMLDEGVGVFRRRAAYWAVRWFGGGSWNDSDLPAVSGQGT
jgi:hypothetical protein